MGNLQKFLHNALESSLHRYFSSLPQIRIIQVGANDGERLDPVVSLIGRYACKAILAEPAPYAGAKLQKKYAAHPDIKILQKAITPQNQAGDLPFWHFQPREGLPFNEDFTLWGSFSRQHLEKFRKAVPHFEDLLTCSLIPTEGINDLLSQSGFAQVDYLQVDAEGLDEELISAIDLRQHKPSLIRFEHMHSDRRRVFQLLDKLSAAGYRTFSAGMDTICAGPEAHRYFRLPALIKLVHANWLRPPVPLSAPHR